MAEIEHGFVSSVEDGKARITVPERDDYLTLPLLIPPHLTYELGDEAACESATEESFYVKKFEFEPGMPVAFVEFPDMTGFIVARLEE